MHLVDASRDGEDAAGTSFEWSGRFPDTNDWDEVSHNTGTEVWRIGTDGTVHASWTGPFGSEFLLQVLYRVARA